MRRSGALVVGLATLCAPLLAGAVTSSVSVESSFAGNGHNASFDGRVFVVRTSAGWEVRLLRPEAITYRSDGLPEATGPMWSPPALILTSPEPATLTENAVAICEPDPARAPYACNEEGDAAAGGPYDCYDLWLFDSDALTPPGEGGFVMRRRHLTLWVENPKTAEAAVHKWDLSSSLEPLTSSLRGIEPTVTADGKLMVYQGHPQNDGTIDILMYSTSSQACAATGWSSPRVLSEMATDPAVVGTYRLAERALRAADGTQFGAGDLVHGAYPWLMPDGSALVFTASLMPCQSENDPPGCGPRRNSFSVLGYPTNWGIAIVDGGVNPATNETVRLFFSSPGADTFSELPVTSGLDVWPFFGSNTANYVELLFDDGLDGNYAGFWHFNENVTAEGELDLLHVPDVSGYFNTGELLGGLEVASTNDGIVGRALTFDGVDDRVEVEPSITLSPVNGITIELWIRPTTDPDCDGENNYRLLLGKGNIDTGTYSLVFEEGRSLHARFRIDGEQRSVITPPLPLDTWTRVSCEYDGPSGEAGCWFGEQRVSTESFPPGTLTANDEPLTIGAPGPRAACPAGDGAFAGMLDELAISRYARRLGQVQGAPDAGPGGGETGEADGGPTGDEDGGIGAESDGGGGCGCRAGDAGGGLFALLIIVALAAVRTAGPGPLRRRRALRGRRRGRRARGRKSR